MRKLTEIVIHCSATQPKWMAGQPVTAAVAEIDRWHRAKGWSGGVGYHYVIDRKGWLGIGRPLGKRGAHVAGHNTGTIGICLLGGYGSNENDKFADHYTPEQDDSLRAFLADLMDEHPTINKISGHNEYAAKACPGFQVFDWQNGRTLYNATRNSEIASRGAIAAFFRAMRMLFGGRK